MRNESLILRSLYLQWLLVHLFPRLREWPVTEWPAVMKSARQENFDRLEEIATMAGVILVAWQIKPMTSVGGSALVAFIAQFVYLAPALLLVLGPFFIRRIRRGLNEVARNRDLVIKANDKQ